jgi:hypothetical protein
MHAKAAAYAVWAGTPVAAQTEAGTPTAPVRARRGAVAVCVCRVITIRVTVRRAQVLKSRATNEVWEDPAAHHAGADAAPAAGEAQLVKRGRASCVVDFTVRRPVMAH